MASWNERAFASCGSDLRARDEAFDQRQLARDCLAIDGDARRVRLRGLLIGLVHGLVVFEIGQHRPPRRRRAAGPRPAAAAVPATFSRLAASAGIDEAMRRWKPISSSRRWLPAKA